MAKSKRMKLIDKCEDLLREILKIERGDKDELTGAPPKMLGLFHVLEKETYPKIRLLKANLELVNWFPTHFDWHHNFYKARDIDLLIKQRIGHHYEQRLQLLNRNAPRLDMLAIEMRHEELKRELNEAKKK